MPTTRHRLDIDGDFLTLRLDAGRLGLSPTRLWNPSPSVHHRTEPYDLPFQFRIGLCGTEETGAKFSPPPYAVVVESDMEAAAVVVRAGAGWHLWNDVNFAADDAGLTVRIDLEGQSNPRKVQPHVEVQVVAGQPGEARMSLLARALRQCYPTPAVGHIPEWWLRPTYCGWGDQVTFKMYHEGIGPEQCALAYCIQGLYERWVRRLDEAGVPVGTVIIDAGWSPAGLWEPDTERWPDLRGFIDRQHAAGRRVLLWLATWLWDGLPDEWCVSVEGVKLTADPTHPDYRRAMRRRVERLLSPSGFDADGFKIDQLSYCPNRRRPIGGPRFGATGAVSPPAQPIRLAGDGWGMELLYRYQKDIYVAAKSAKPDALVTSSTVHPYFHDTLDMVRLHDMGQVASDIFAAMGARAELSRAALPGKPIDADDWVHSDYDLWLRYTMGSGALGVPCTFYAQRFMLNWESEPATRDIPLADLRRIAAAWRS